MKKVINLDKEYLASTIEGNKLTIETEKYIIQIKNKILLDKMRKWYMDILERCKK